METSNIWLADPETFNKTLKSLVHDDKGIIQIENEQIIFVGKKGTRKIEDIKEVSLVNSKFNWGNLFVTVLAAIVYGFLNNKSNLFTGSILVFAILMFLLLMIKQKWIKIYFKDETGSKVVYISDGSGMGWKGMFGGTEKLFYEIKTATNKS